MPVARKTQLLVLPVVLLVPMSMLLLIHVKMGKLCGGA